MSKSFWGVIAAIVLVFVAVVAFSGGNKGSGSNGSKSKSSALTQHKEGSGKSGVTLVEYGDYQCPYCQAYYTSVKQVVADLNDQITFQFRNFPLTSLHRNAFAAARAAEAADMQGKFWQMHDLLYANNDPNGASGWVAASDPTSFFDQYAQQIGLDMTKYHSDFSSTAVNDRINADMNEGNKLGITGTPTFYLDDKKVEFGNDAAAIEKIVQAEITKKTAAH